MDNIQLVKHYRTGNVWLDTYLTKQDINLEDIVMRVEEVSEVKWATYDEIEELYKNNQFIENRWEFVRNVIKCALYIGKEIKVEIDRPIGSTHPKYPNFKYTVNYGFVPNTISGDGEEIDCYVLGENNPLDEYIGKCIAVIHRMDEDDDKLIIVPEGKEFLKREIRALTDFQERYYKSTIIM